VTRAPGRGRAARSPRRGAPGPRSRGVALTVLAALVVALVAAAIVPARAEVGLGGNIGWPPGATFPFAAGETSRIRVSAVVQNLGSQNAVMELLTDLPDEVRLEPVGEPVFTLKPGELRELQMDIVVEDFVVPGTYPVSVVIRQSNVPPAEGGGIAYVPAIGGRFVAEVVGDAPLLTVNAVSSDDGRPIPGILALAYVDERGPIVLEEVEGSTLERRVIPGDYLVRFRIPGITQLERRVTVLPGEDQVVTLEVSGVEFLAVDAVPVLEDERVVAAELSAVIRNTLRELDGPVLLTVAVARSGETVDSFQLASLPSLPTGILEQASVYRPPGGFTPGTWTFTFTLSSDTFSITADAVAEIEVPLPWWQRLLLPLLSALVLLLALLLAALLRRRARHRRAERA
jgi:hypothetical protein